LPYAKTCFSYFALLANGVFSELEFWMVDKILLCLHFASKFLYDTPLHVQRYFFSCWISNMLLIHYKNIIKHMLVFLKNLKKHGLLRHNVPLIMRQWTNKNLVEAKKFF
jgi:hypothetical protein